MFLKPNLTSFLESKRRLEKDRAGLAAENQDLQGIVDHATKSQVSFSLLNYLNVLLEV